MKGEYVLLALVTFVVLLSIAFFAYPVAAILIGILFGFLGLLLGYGTSAGDFMINIAKITWDHWIITISTVFILSLLYSFISKKMHE